jgi:hypothetical protein
MTPPGSGTDDTTAGSICVMVRGADAVPEMLTRTALSAGDTVLINRIRPLFFIVTGPTPTPEAI